MRGEKKTNILCPVTVMCDSDISVHKDSFIRTQPCPVTYRVSPAAFAIQGELSRRDPVWPAELKNLSYLALFGDNPLHPVTS